ncbi:MAG: hypothetical protein K0R51_2853, partial [Cytophagaceae bacterium]|nr:hypothetical protein [Cytophagaceae bacterium]
MKNLFFILYFLIITNGFSQTNSIEARMENYWSKITDTTFDSLVIENKLKVSIPDNFIRVDLKKNRNVVYQYAVKDKASNFEIRIFIKSFKQLMKDSAVFNPNRFSKNALVSMSLNASGNILPNIPQIDEFPPEAVKNEFNADWGATTAFAPNSEFGKGFNFCVLNSFRLNDTCEAYVFYLFDDMPNQKTLLQ